MKFSTLIASAAALLLVARGLAAEWTYETVNGRRYKKYVPDNFDPATGLMMFFHGVGGNADYMTGSGAGSYDIAYWANNTGFLALVPDGSSDSGGGGGGPGGGPKGRRLKGKPGGGGGGGSYRWNMNPATCTDLTDTSCNDVAHVLDILDQDQDAIDVTTAGGPELALGFSNGAGMASMMGCFDSSSIYAAHVAVHIDKDATFSVTCAGDLVNGDKRKLQNRELNRNDPVWMAAGESDFFLDTVGVSGFLDQFKNWCTDTPSMLDACAISGCTTFDCEVCNANGNEGELCVYNEGFGHEMAPSMTYAAWEYLTFTSSNSFVCEDSCPPSGDGGGGDKPGECTLDVEAECTRNGVECCKDGLKCHKGFCT